MELPLPTLSTARIALRPPTTEDAPGLLALHSRCAKVPAATQFLLRPLPTTLDEVTARLGPGPPVFSSERTWFQWLLRLRAASEAAPADVVGYAAFVRWDHENRRSEVAYAIDPSHWGTGLAVEAVLAIIGFARRELGLHRVEAHIDPDNTASIRVAEKLGFAREGLLRDNVWTGERYVSTVIYAAVLS